MNGQHTGQYNQGNNGIEMSYNGNAQDESAMYQSGRFEDPATPGKMAYGNNALEGNS
jgi:hypothetical protein